MINETLPDAQGSMYQTTKVNDIATDVRQAKLKMWMTYDGYKRIFIKPDDTEIVYEDMDYKLDLGELSHFEVEQILLYRHGYTNTIVIEKPE
jgi:hypothetical protein